MKGEHKGGTLKVVGTVQSVFAVVKARTVGGL